MLSAGRGREFESYHGDCILNITASVAEIAAAFHARRYVEHAFDLAILSSVALRLRNITVYCT